MRECGEVGTRGIIIISAGFREIGEEGRKLEQQILEEKAKFEGMRILGPNCLGNHRARASSECQFRRSHSGKRTHRVHLAVGAPCVPRSSIGPSIRALAFPISCLWATCWM